MMRLVLLVLTTASAGARSDAELAAASAVSSESAGEAAGAALAEAAAQAEGGAAAAGKCHPICQWKCDSPVCPMICDPVCERPRCAHRCEQVRERCASWRGLLPATARAGCWRAEPCQPLPRRLTPSLPPAAARRKVRDQVQAACVRGALPRAELRIRQLPRVQDRLRRARLQERLLQPAPQVPDGLPQAALRLAVPPPSALRAAAVRARVRGQHQVRRQRLCRIGHPLPLPQPRAGAVRFYFPRRRTGGRGRRRGRGR